MAGAGAVGYRLHTTDQTLDDGLGVRPSIR
jgi:hypothetical protein